MMVRPKETGTDKSKPVAAEHIGIKKHGAGLILLSLRGFWHLFLLSYVYVCSYICIFF